MRNSNTSLPLVSVVVPVFNEFLLLRRCTQSIIHQTYKHLEIILVDDGSTDGSSKLCDDIQKTDKRITVIHEKNAGLSVARNTGISYSHGNFIAFVDSDDYLDLDYINDMVKAIMYRNDIDLVISDFQTDNPKFSHPVPHKTKIMNGYSAIIKAEKSKNNIAYVVPWDKLYRRRLFNYVMFPAGKIHEDTFTYYKFLYNSRNVFLINSPGYHYCMNKQGITAKQGSLFSIDSLEAFADKCIFYLDNQSLKNSIASIAIKQFESYYLLMIRQRWKPHNIKENNQLNSIKCQIKSHNKSILSVLTTSQKILYLSEYLMPRLTAIAYYSLRWFKHKVILRS